MTTVSRGTCRLAATSGLEDLGEICDLEQPLPRFQVEKHMKWVLPLHDRGGELFVPQQRDFIIIMEPAEARIRVSAVRTKAPDAELAEVDLAHDLEALVTGVYTPKPGCGAAEKSLFVASERAMFLYKNVPKLSPPETDHFVFSHECRQLDSGEIRDAVMHLLPKWQIHRKILEEKTEVDAYIEGLWIRAEGVVDASPFEGGKESG